MCTVYFHAKGKACFATFGYLLRMRIRLIVRHGHLRESATPTRVICGRIANQSVNPSEPLKKSQRCPMPENITPALLPGQLSKLFEDIPEKFADFAT